MYKSTVLFPFTGHEALFELTFELTQPIYNQNGFSCVLAMFSSFLVPIVKKHRIRVSMTEPIPILYYIAL